MKAVRNSRNQKSNTSRKADVKTFEIKLTSKQAEVAREVAMCFRATPEEIIAAASMAFFSMTDGDDQMVHADDFRAALHEFVDKGFTPVIKSDYLQVSYDYEEREASHA